MPGCPIHDGKNYVPKSQTTNQLWWVIDTSDSWLTMLSLSWMIDETHSIRSFSSFSPWLSFKRRPSPWHFTPITPLKSASGHSLGFPTTCRQCDEHLEDDAATHRHQTVRSQPRSETGAWRILKWRRMCICYASYIHIKVHITFIFICYTYK